MAVILVYKYILPKNNQDAASVKQVIDIPKTETDCKAKNGTWAPIGTDQKPSCNLQTQDKDRVCSDSDQCQGACLLNLSPQDRDKATDNPYKTKGICSEWVIVVGCKTFVESGMTKVICID